MSERYFERLDYKGSLDIPLTAAADTLKLGDYESHDVILVGYEDLNVRMQTSNDSTFFVKFFSKERTDKECERYVSVIRTVTEGGIHHPALYSMGDSSILRPADTGLRLIVMEWLEDKYRFDTNPVTDEDRLLLIEQAVKINQLNVEIAGGDFVYDSWSISSFPAEFKEWNHILTPEDRALIEPVLLDYQTIEVESLPKAFVHGDLIRTNIIRNENGLFVFDFSVSNIYPRVQELAVLLCDVFFDASSESESKRLYNLLVTEYQKYLPLSEAELSALSTFTRVAHAMHILGAARDKHQGGGGEENDMWWNLGRAGLKMNIIYS